MKNYWTLIGVYVLAFVFIIMLSSQFSTSGSEENINLEEASIATFAGGCFWCTEHDFQIQEGVLEVISGYSGGEEENPSYQEVSAGKTGHVESVQVYYDPDKISYSDLLYLYWRHVDPTDNSGQFVDRGLQYRPVIFYHDETQKRLAEMSKEDLTESGKFNSDIKVEIREFDKFYAAEEYHQDFYEKNSLKYKFYRSGSGRDQFIEIAWGPNALDLDRKNDELREKLTEIQYYVTQEDGTEKPFDNEYWDNKDQGIYVDVVSGEPLFSSTDKYESGTGWPSFTKPLVEENIVEREDNKLLVKRTEIRSSGADSHLGHLFSDGPEPLGLRYCMNSAALRFIPAENLEEEGYSEFSYLFG